MNHFSCCSPSYTYNNICYFSYNTNKKFIFLFFLVDSSVPRFSGLQMPRFCWTNINSGLIYLHLAFGIIYFFFSTSKRLTPSIMSPFGFVVMRLCTLFSANNVRSRAIKHEDVGERACVLVNFRKQFEISWFRIWLKGVPAKPLARIKLVVAYQTMTGSFFLQNRKKRNAKLHLVN